MNETNVSKALWPSYALRAWLGALLAQTRRARASLEGRIDASEKETTRLRRQHERAGVVIDSLQDALRQVDAQLRQVLDRDLERASGEEGEGSHDEPGHTYDQAQLSSEHSESDNAEGGLQPGGGAPDGEPHDPTRRRGGRRGH